MTLRGYTVQVVRAILAPLGRSVVEMSDASSRDNIVNGTSGQKPSGSWTPPTFVWIVICVLLIVVVFSAISNGGNFSLGAGPVTMQYESPLVPKEVFNQVSPQQVTDQQKQIQSQASQLQNVVQASPPPSQAGQLNVTGNWSGAYNGLQYIIYQQGSAISIEEYVAQYGPQSGATAFGTGTISDHTIRASYQTIYQTFGDITLVASPDGRQLSGQAVDRMTRLTQSVVMVR
jgi:hypothetical protein